MKKDSKILKEIWHTWKWNSMEKLFKNLSNTPLKLLDGCASDFFTSQIAVFFPSSEVFGIDSYKEAIAFSRKS